MRLAFDDGPLPTTAHILDILEKANVQATFFVIGRNIYPEQKLLQRMVRDGHTIGNHSWTHAPLINRAVSDIRDELRWTHQAIKAACGVECKDFRPPFVRWNDNVIVPTAQEFGYTVHLTPSFGDYGMTPDEIVDAAARVAGTLWMHDGHWPTVQALPRILKGAS